MKKLVVFFIGTFICLGLTAQDLSYRDQNLLAGGISLGHYSYGYIGSRSIGVPPLSAYYELGVHEHITAGPFVALARWSYRYTAPEYNYSWTFFSLGGRGSFHITGFMNELLGTNFEEEKIDWYLTLMAGLEHRQYSHSGIYAPDYGNRTTFFIGPTAGVRYYFTDNLAAYFEGGRGIMGAFSFGVSLRR